MKIIYIPIENFNRELLGKLYFSMNLVNSLKNYKIIIGEKNKLRNLLSFAPRGIIIEKGMRKGMIKNLKKFKKKNHKIFLMDEEAITYLNDNFYFKRNIDKGVENYVDLFLAAGERHKNTLIKKIKKSKISIIGNLRYDIKKKNYIKIYKDFVKENKKKFGQFFLINSRFGNVNKNSSFSSNFDKNYYNSSLKIFKKFLNLPIKVSHCYPNSAIVIRPHPSESSLIWHDKYREKKNFFIIYKDSVMPWILGCKKVYQNRCSTALDAFFLKKNIINFDPDKKKFEHKKLFSILQKKNSKLKINEKKIITKYVENFFSHNASKKLIKIIKETEITDNKLSSLNYFFFLSRIYNLVKFIKNFIKNDIDKDYINYTEQKIGENNKLFVIKIFNLMKKTYTNNQNLSIRFFSSDMFLIEKKI